MIHTFSVTTVVLLVTVLYCTVVLVVAVLLVVILLYDTRSYSIKKQDQLRDHIQDHILRSKGDAPPPSHWLARPRVR